MMESSTGLSRRAAVALAYSGWWVTGLIFWLLERTDRAVRFQAAQAVIVFGAAAVLVTAFAFLAAASLSFLPSAFTVFVVAAAATWAAAVAVWGIAMWKTARGDELRVPVAADWAERFADA